MKHLSKLIHNREYIGGMLIFLLFFALLLGILVPSLRIGFTNSFSDALIYRSIVASLFLLISSFLFSRKAHSINLVFGLLFIMFLLTGCVAIFLPYDRSDIAITTKFIAFLYLFSIIITVFSFFEVLPSYLSKKSIIIFFILIDIVMLVCTVYSLIAEFNDIIAAFFAKGEDAHFHQIHSFFDNKNSYGFMLFVAIVGTLFIYKDYQKKWLAFPIVYFGINLVISRAKTALLLVVVLFLIYCGYKFFTSFKGHKVRNISIVCTGLVILTLFLLIVFVPTIYSSNTFFASLSNFVKEAFIGQGIRSISARLTNLFDAGPLFSNPRIILGYGEYVCRIYANTCCIILGPIDNAYIYNSLAGGIVKTILFIYCYCRIFKQVIRLTRLSNLSPLYKTFIWSLEIALLIYGMFENFQILGSNHVAIVYLLFSYSIPYIICNESD